MAKAFCLGVRYCLITDMNKILRKFTKISQKPKNEVEISRNWYFTRHSRDWIFRNEPVRREKVLERAAEIAVGVRLGAESKVQVGLVSEVVGPRERGRSERRGERRRDDQQQRASELHGVSWPRGVVGRRRAVASRLSPRASAHEAISACRGSARRGAREVQRSVEMSRPCEPVGLVCCTEG